MPAIARALVVFFLACLAWVFFRITDFQQAMFVLNRMLVETTSTDASLVRVSGFAANREEISTRDACI